MSRPKELNFFVEDMNWGLGVDWYRSHFPANAAVRGETSPHYTNRPALRGSRRAHARDAGIGRAPDLHGPPPDRPAALALPTQRRRRLRGSRARRRAQPAIELATSSAASTPSSSSPTSRPSAASGSSSSRARSWAASATRPCAGSSASRASTRTSPRPSSTANGKPAAARARAASALMDRAVRMPGLRALDRNFDRLPERMRWMVERLVHDPESGEAAKPELDPELRESLAATFRPDTARLEAHGRAADWLGALDEDRRSRLTSSPALPSSSPLSFASAGTSRSCTEPSQRTSATTGPGPLRRPPATSPTAGPSRGSSAAGPARAPRSRRTRSRGSAQRSARTRRRPRARGAGTTRTSWR